MWPWKKKGTGRWGGDRRGSGREGATLEVWYRVADAGTHGRLTGRQQGLIHDIAEGGCGLTVPSLMLDGFDLRRCLEFPRDYLLELKIMPKSGGTWRLYASVRWIAPERDGSQTGFRLGVRFEDPVALPGRWRRLLLAPAPVALADAAGN